MNKIEAVLFDLDGVLVDTAKYHYRAWQTIAKEFDLVLTLDHNEYLKGVSRIDSFKLILQWAGKEMKESQMQPYLEDKNTRYLTLIEGLTPENLLPGALNWLQYLKNKNIKIGLGSASKNAKIILEKLEIHSFFQTLVDGNHVKKGKPDPEVFLIGSKNLKVQPQNCLVVEDSIAGIQAAQAAKMNTLALGEPKQFTMADSCHWGLDKIEPAQLLQSYEN
ncbi:MAG: beta-phosphoglucomutase [Flavobacteriaceae bacterium]|nr:beta-phosphoglucomutase [Flavobacteriaceae bacterium]|tara:strand:- start:234 stop:893 length:660 start_codon:yes stop_codon:yes gene_type:complete